MSKQWVKTQALLVLLVSSALPAHAQVQNPFLLGTRLRPLNPKDLEDLQSNVSPLKILKDALETEAKLDQASGHRLLAEAAIDFVSEVGVKRRYLVSVLVLNQAMELSYGIPSYDGRQIERPAILAGANPGLLRNILANAVDRAIDYATELEKQGSALIDLPFRDVALDSAYFSLSMLIDVSEEQKLAFLAASLKHWAYLMSETDLNPNKKDSMDIIRARRLLQKLEDGSANKKVVQQECYDFFERLVREERESAKAYLENFPKLLSGLGFASLNHGAYANIDNDDLYGEIVSDASIRMHTDKKITPGWFKQLREMHRGSIVAKRKSIEDAKAPISEIQGLRRFMESGRAWIKFSPQTRSICPKEKQTISRIDENIYKGLQSVSDVSGTRKRLLEFVQKWEYEAKHGGLEHLTEAVIKAVSEEPTWLSDKSAIASESFFRSLVSQSGRLFEDTSFVNAGEDFFLHVAIVQELNAQRYRLKEERPSTSKYFQDDDDINLVFGNAKERAIAAQAAAEKKKKIANIDQKLEEIKQKKAELIEELKVKAKTLNQYIAQYKPQISESFSSDAREEMYVVIRNYFDKLCVKNVQFKDRWVARANSVRYFALIAQLEKLALTDKTSFRKYPDSAPVGVKEISHELEIAALKGELEDGHYEALAKMYKEGKTWQTLLRSHSILLRRLQGNYFLVSNVYNSKSVTKPYSYVFSRAEYDKRCLEYESIKSGDYSLCLSSVGF